LVLYIEKSLTSSDEVNIITSTQHVHN
jgi:hypothetical protein